MMFTRVVKPGFDPSYCPNLRFVKFFNVDFKHVQHRIRQKYREIEHYLIKIHEYSSCDIRLLIDNDYSTIIDFTNNKILVQHENHDSVALLLFHLKNITDMFRYDRYPESVTTMSQYNHYKSLINQYYG